MAENHSPEHQARQPAPERGPDRRHCAEFGPPPYQTGAGLVWRDRRSHLDRRAAWIRNFRIGSETNGEI